MKALDMSLVKGPGSITLRSLASLFWKNNLMEFMPDCDLMKTITVALRRGYHTVHNDLLAHPPAGIKYEVAQSVSTDSNKALAEIKRGIFRLYTSVTKR